MRLLNQLKSQITHMYYPLALRKSRHDPVSGADEVNSTDSCQYHSGGHGGIRAARHFRVVGADGAMALGAFVLLGSVWRKCVLSFESFVFP